MAEMKKNCSCSGKNANGGPSEPHLFSTHLWNDKGQDGKNPDATFDPTTGKADMSNWDITGRPALPEWKPDGNGGYRFDYGWVNPDGTIQHANHYHNPPWHPMTVYTSTESEWQNGAPNLYQYPDFNTEVWCVDCNNDRF